MIQHLHDSDLPEELDQKKHGSIEVGIGPQCECICAVGFIRFFDVRVQTTNFSWMSCNLLCIVAKDSRINIFNWRNITLNVITCL